LGNTYGGFKQSSIGKEGIENYLEIKTINIYTGNPMPRWYIRIKRRNNLRNYNIT